jgi:hypothetical protein
MSWINPFSWFKKEEKQEYPYQFAVIELNPVAKSSGINDDLNKIIKIYKGGEVVDELPYSKQMLESIKEIDKIPIHEEVYGDSEEFEFDSFESLNLAKYKTK